MALVHADRVKATSTTTGTGTYTLGSAVTGWQSFAVIGNGNTCYYGATDGTNWEVGIGTYTSSGTTLARTSILASSNSNNPVNWSAGTRTLFVMYPSSQLDLELLRAGGTMTGQILLVAGASGSAPLKFQSGTNLTTAQAGAMEYDGKVFYASPVASNRAAQRAVHFIIADTGNTLINQAGVQPIFISPANGAITLPGATSYLFECNIRIGNMSSSSGSYGFAIGGTATLTSIAWISNSNDVLLPQAANNTQCTFNATASNATLATASAEISGVSFIKGIFRVNAAGTIIPQISQTNAAAALIQAGSYFKCWAIGSNTVTSCGNWS